MKDVTRSNIKKALRLIDDAGDSMNKAFIALGYCQRIFEEMLEESSTDISNTDLDDAVDSLADLFSDVPEPAVSSIFDLSEETVDIIRKNVPEKLHIPMVLSEYCEEKKEQLKHDVIAEEEATLYLHRAYLKDEICKRFPITNVTMKKILHGHGITNIEEFYEYFVNPANWWTPFDWGLSIDDRSKLHNLFMTLNEESGCLADDKFKAYLQKITGKDNVTREINALARDKDVHTKSQLRYLVRENGMLPPVRGMGKDTEKLITDYVMQEISLHMV